MLRARHFESLDSTSISGIVDEPSTEFKSVAWLLITISGVPAVNLVSNNNFLLLAQIVFKYNQ